MAALLLRDLPTDLHRKLKRRAAQNRRSMAKEALLLLEMALATDQEQAPMLPKPFQGNFAITDEWLDQARNAGRA